MSKKRVNIREFTNVLRYAFSVQDENGFIYSLDKLRLNTTMLRTDYDDVIGYLSKCNQDRFITFSDLRANIIKAQNANRKVAYRGGFTLTYKNGGVLWHGFDRMGVSRSNSRYAKATGCLEFNPNRFAGCEAFWRDLKNILSHFSEVSISRFDLAIDMPVLRSSVYMTKDRRNYNNRVKSYVDRTEYLGCRNNEGFVKLYNKQLESMLIDAVTRLEITRGLYDCNLPDIYIFPKGKSPDNLIAKSLVNSYNDKAILADMTPARRKRILSMIKDCKVEFDKTCIDRITEYAREIVKGDNYVEF